MYKRKHHRQNYVDLHGRVVLTEEDERGEIYVSLPELKKSGFEFFLEGSLPKPGGYLKSFTDLQQQQFELYMRMKAAKFLSRSITNINQADVENTIKNIKEYYEIGDSPDRTVAYSNNSRNFTITTKTNSPRSPNDYTQISSAKTNQTTQNSFQKQQSPSKRLNYQQNNNFRSGNTEKNSSHHQTPFNSERNSSHHQTPGNSERNNSYCQPSDNSQKNSSYHQTSCGNNESHHSNDNASYKSSDKSLNISKNNCSNSRQSGSSFSINQKSLRKPFNQSTVSTEPVKEHGNLTESINLDISNGSTIVSSTPVKHPDLPTPVLSNDNVKDSAKLTDLTAAVLPNDNIKKTILKRKCVTDTICNSGIFEYVAPIDDKTIVAFAIPTTYTDEFGSLSDIDCGDTNDLNFLPAVGDLIAVYHTQEEVYARAIVQKIIDNSYTCLLVDYGVIITSTNIKKLPKQYCDIPEFSCTVTGSVADIQEIINCKENFNLKITAPGKLCLEVDKINKKFEVLAGLWNPNTQSSPPKSQNSIAIEQPKVYKLSENQIVLKSNDVVVISSHVDGSLIVRTKQCVLLLKEVGKAIENFEGEPVKAPVINQLLLCPYSSEDDTKYYRVQVLSIKDSSVIIKYVDYGDQHEVPISSLRTINETLATISNTSMQIKLEGFVDKQYSDKQLEFLADCCERKEKFTAVSSSTAQVFDLLSANKSSLSKKLIDLEKPPTPVVIEKPPAPIVIEKSKTPVVKNDKKFHPIVNCHVDIGLNTGCCVYAGDLNIGLVTFCPTVAEVTSRLLEVSELLSDYSNNNSSSYKPEINELCVAKYEDDWYRATVIEEDGEYFDVLFVDYGNISRIKVDDIREITDKLASYAACAAICNLKDLVKDKQEIEPSILEKLTIHLVEGIDYEFEVLSVEDEVYNITIPKVMDELKKEGVL